MLVSQKKYQNGLSCTNEINKVMQINLSLHSHACFEKKTIFISTFTKKDHINIWLTYKSILEKYNIHRLTSRQAFQR